MAAAFDYIIVGAGFCGVHPRVPSYRGLVCSAFSSWRRAGAIGD